jgi:outer membrane protein assembly factor BamB
MAWGNPSSEIELVDVCTVSGSSRTVFAAIGSIYTGNRYAEWDGLFVKYDGSGSIINQWHGYNLHGSCLENGPDGNLYFADNDGQLSILLAEGTSQAICSLPGRHRSNVPRFEPAISGIYVPKLPTHICLVSRRGEEQWRYQLDSGPTAICADDSGHVYCGNEEGQIHRLTEQGECKDVLSLPEEDSIGDLAVGNTDTVYAGSTEGRIYAFESGESPAWHRSFDFGSIQAIKVDQAENIYALAADGVIVTIHPSEHDHLQTVSPRDGVLQFDVLEV